MHYLGNDLKRFLAGCTGKLQLSTDTLCEHGLALLRHAPAARLAVLEFFSRVFDDHTSGCVERPDAEPDTHLNHIRRFLDILSDLMEKESLFSETSLKASVCRWCMTQLGLLSEKYSQQLFAGKDKITLTDKIGRWSDIPGIKVLLDICDLCYKPVCMNVFVDSLLAASAAHQPNFDWVIAHFGSRHPAGILHRILLCSMKDVSEGGSREGAVRFQSALEVLNYFVSNHKEELRTAIHQLIADCVVTENGDKVQQRLLSPFLMLLATSGSVALSNLIIVLMAESLDKYPLQSLTTYFQNQGFSHQEQMSQRQMGTVLMLRTSEPFSLNILKFLLEHSYSTTSKSDFQLLSQHAQNAAIHCRKILTNICNRILRALHKNKTSFQDFPVLRLLEGTECDYLTERMLDGCNYSTKLLIGVVVLGHKVSTFQCLATNVTHYRRKKNIITLHHVLDHLELHRKQALDRLMDGVFHQMTLSNASIKKSMMQTLLDLLTEEADKGRTRIECCLSQRIPRLLHFLDSLPQEGMCRLVLQLVTKLKVAEAKVSVSESVVMTSAVCRAILRYRNCFEVPSSELKARRLLFTSLCNLLTQICALFPYTKGPAIRDLVYGYWHYPSFVRSKPISDMKLLQDCKPSLDIAGQLKRAAPPKKLTVSDWAADQDFFTLVHKLIRIKSPNSTISGARILSCALSQLICPEGSLLVQAFTRDKVSVEACIRVIHDFKRLPGLWNLLELAAASEDLVLVHAAPVLVSLFNSFALHWESRSAFSSPTKDSEMLNLCNRLIALLRVNQILPHPLNRLDAILSHLETSELQILMEQTRFVVIEVSERVKKEGPESLKQPGQGTYLERVLPLLYRIMHKHVGTLAPLYGEFVSI